MAIIGNEQMQTVEAVTGEVLSFARNLKDIIEAFLQIERPESKLSGPTPMRNPIDEIMSNLSETRGLLGDIQGLIHSDIFERIRS